MTLKLIRFMGVLAGLLAVGCAPSLAARPHLVASWPVDGASLSVQPDNLELTFNQPLAPASTWVTVLREDDGAPTATQMGLDQDPTRLRVKLLEPAAGTFQLHWHATAAGSGEVSEGDQTFTLQNETPAPPRLALSPAKAEVGERLEVVGKGFAARSAVQLAIGDDAQPLKEVQTDTGGTFNLELAVPDSVPFGIQTVSAVDGNGRRAMAALQVRWGGWPPAVASDVGQPGPGPGQVTFMLQVRNRSDYVLEHVSVVLQDPDGSTLVASNPDAQHHDGTLTWEIPVMDRGQFGPFQATYQTSAAVVSHSWLEFRHRHARGCAGDQCLPAFISVSTADSSTIAPAQ
jgi:methionine-rich copper-binding protein CopC